MPANDEEGMPASYSGVQVDGFPIERPENDTK
jgi:hypothetical protein